MQKMTDAEHEENARKTIAASIEAKAREYDVYPEEGETAAELADRTITILEEMVCEITDAQDELRNLFDAACEYEIGEENDQQANKEGDIHG